MRQDGGAALERGEVPAQGWSGAGEPPQGRCCGGYAGADLRNVRGRRDGDEGAACVFFPPSIRSDERLTLAWCVRVCGDVDGCLAEFYFLSNIYF